MANLWFVEDQTSGAVVFWIIVEAGKPLQYL